MGIGSCSDSDGRGRRDIQRWWRHWQWRWIDNAMWKWRTARGAIGVSGTAVWSGGSWRPPFTEGGLRGDPPPPTPPVAQAPAAQRRGVPCYRARTAHWGRKRVRPCRGQGHNSQHANERGNDGGGGNILPHAPCTLLHGTGSTTSIHATWRCSPVLHAPASRRRRSDGPPAAGVGRHRPPKNASPLPTNLWAVARASTPLFTPICPPAPRHPPAHPPAIESL